MKAKNIYLLFVLLIVLMVSCKKDEPKVSEDELNVTSECAVNINTGIQTFVLSTLSVASEAGYNATVPDMPEMPSGTKGLSGKSSTDYSWSGPNGDGWYTRYLNSSNGFTYYEKLRFRDTIDYYCSMTYYGADGSYENITTTRFIKYTQNEKTLYKGYSDWNFHVSGYSNSSRLEWKINFNAWNPETCAGIYDWYWGVTENSAGNIIPFHRFLNFTATETINDMLHCHLTFYDTGNIERWSYEYDTYRTHVDMPELPSVE